MSKVVVKKLILTSFFAFIVLQITTVAGAIITPQNIQVTVPESTVSITGIASPGALVNIKEVGSTIASIVADSIGSFSVNVNRIAGIHTIDVEYTDINGLRSAVNTQTISVQPQQTTSYNVFLSPTIIRSTPSPLLKGSIIQIRGYSSPTTQMILQIDGMTNVFEVLSDAQGFYEFLVDSSIYETGSYTASTMTDDGVNSSDRSKFINFEVQSLVTPSIPDIIVRPNQLPPPIVLNPEDGAVINNDRVIIRGESVPNSQINIYENNIIFGSIFTDEFGKWSIEYITTASLVSLSFEACLGGRCSVASRSLTLRFNLESINSCMAELELAKYRFWGVNIGEQINLEVKTASSNGVVEIDWGDSVVEKFDILFSEKQTYSNSYNNSGNFNGKITYTAVTSGRDSCTITKYFSVRVLSEPISTSSRWLFLFIFSAIVFAIIYSNIKQNKQ